MPTSAAANYGHFGGATINGRPPGSFALPGIHSVAAAVAARNKQVESPVDRNPELYSKNRDMNSSGATTSSSSTIRHIHSPDATNHVHSPLNGGTVIGMQGFPMGVPHMQQHHLADRNREASPKNERPSSLGSVIGVNPSINNNNNSHHHQPTKQPGKKTRWLLCYPSGGAASSESPSPPHEEAPGGRNPGGGQASNASTPSPTDGGFKIPNSQSNERPTSLPVALLNSSQRNGKSLQAPESAMLLWSTSFPIALRWEI